MAGEGVKVKPARMTYLAGAMEKTHPCWPLAWASIIEVTNWLISIRPMFPKKTVTAGPLALAEAFEHLYGKEAAVFRAPGRVNLIGEHTDYNQGLVLPFNTALNTWVACSPRDDHIINAFSCHFEQGVSFNPEAPNDQGSTSGWAAYILGVVMELLEQGFSLPGADLLIDGDIPLGGGMSSSASLAVALALALLDSSGQTVSGKKLAGICQRAEHRAVGVPCGIMDPFVIANGRQGYAMQLDCRDHSINWAPLPPELGLLVVDSGVKHALADGAYAQRRSECESAVECLRQQGLECASLRDVTMDQLRDASDALTAVQFKRAKHVLGENQRVLATTLSLLDGDLALTGRLINESHSSLQDDFEVSCPELDYLAELAQSTEGSLGARMFGGGFGGCVIVLAKADLLPSVTRSIVRQYTLWSGSQPFFHAVKTAPAAGRA